MKARCLMLFRLTLVLAAVSHTLLHSKPLEPETNEGSTCESRILGQPLVGPQAWSTPSRCQRGFGLCWLASSLSFVEWSLKQRGVSARFSFEHLAFHYFFEMGKRALLAPDEKPLEKLSMTGGHFRDGLSIIREYGLMPESLVTPGALVREASDRGGSADVVRARSVLAQLKILILFWRERLIQDTHSKDLALEGLQTFLHSEFGTWPTEFEFHGHKTTPQNLLNFHPLSEIWSHLEKSNDPSHPWSIEETHPSFLSSSKDLEDRLRRHLLTLKLPVLASMAWNPIALGAHSEFGERVYGPLVNIPGLPKEFQNRSLRSSEKLKILGLVDRAWIAYQSNNVKDLQHALLLVDALLGPNGEITHVILLNSHGERSGYAGYHIVPYEILLLYGPSFWFVSSD